MNVNLKIVSCATVSLLLAAGCMSEQERRERAAQEKARQEQAERDARDRRERLARESKERAERLAKAQEERTKREKEEHLAKTKSAIESYWNEMSELNNRIILSYKSPKERGWDDEDAEDVWLRRMLKNWVSPRLNITEAERQRGISILQEFGSKYMPNSYASYKLACECAQKVQQVFNENFPNALPPSQGDATYLPYCKVLKRLSKARSDYFRKHDELCHFYILHKTGVASPTDLAKIDSSPIYIWLLEEMPFGLILPLEDASKMPKDTHDKIMEFARKQTPETYSVLKHLSEERKEAVALYCELLKECRVLDVARFELSMVACCEKANYIMNVLENQITSNLQALQLEFSTMEKDAVTISKWDHENALKLKKFADMLPSFVVDRAKGPLIAANSKMKEFGLSCDDVLQWHLYATGCLCNGSWHNGATYDATPNKFGIYQYCYRRNASSHPGVKGEEVLRYEGRSILKEEKPVWKMAFGKFDSAKFKGGCEGGGMMFSANVDAPDMCHLFPATQDGHYHSQGKIPGYDGDGEYEISTTTKVGIRVDNLHLLLLDKRKSPFLKRLQELDGDKVHYDLVLGKWEYGIPQYVKVKVTK